MVWLLENDSYKVLLMKGGILSIDDIAVESA